MSDTFLLVVEDEPSIAEVVSLYLKRAGYQVQGRGRRAGGPGLDGAPDARPGDPGCDAAQGGRVYRSPAGCATAATCRSSC